MWKTVRHLLFGSQPICIFDLHINKFRVQYNNKQKLRINAEAKAAFKSAIHGRVIFKKKKITDTANLLITISGAALCKWLFTAKISTAEATFLRIVSAIRNKRIKTKKQTNNCIQNVCDLFGKQPRQQQTDFFHYLMKSKQLRGSDCCCITSSARLSRNYNAINTAVDAAKGQLADRPTKQRTAHQQQQ